MIFWGVQKGDRKLNLRNESNYNFLHQLRKFLLFVFEEVLKNKLELLLNEGYTNLLDFY